VEDVLVQRARTVSESVLCGVGTRWEHVQGVARTAQRVVDGLGCRSGASVAAAAWLHDVGYGLQLRRTGFHPVDGANFAASQDFPPLVVSLVAFHTGAAVEAARRGLSAELEAFDPPPADLLDVVTYADLTTGPDGSPVSVADRLAEIFGRYPPTDVVYGAVFESEPALLASVARVEDRLRLR
jgi:hypothetical protein